MPVLILTARGNWEERVEGIDAGADDYLAKPFQMPELLARLRAIIRRSQGKAAPAMTAGRMKLDPRTRSVSLDGEPAELTPLEYRCLHYLLANPERHVSQMELTEQLYSQDFERESNSIEVLVGRLRRNLARTSSSPAEVMVTGSARHDSWLTEEAIWRASAFYQSPVSAGFAGDGASGAFACVSLHDFSVQGQSRTAA